MMTWTAGLLLAVGAGGAATGDRTVVPGMIVTRTVIRQSVMIHIPTRQPDAPPARQSSWRERRGPACVAMARVAAAAVVADDSVDLLLRGGDRVRAKFEDDCTDLDYYRGFYIRPGADGRICADRDSVRARSGGECRIERFRTLELRAAKSGGGLVARIRRRLSR